MRDEKKTTAVLAVIMLLLLCVSGAAILNSKDNSATIKNETLNIIGNKSDGVASYLGIPYAEAPVGELRFAPPQEKKMWTSTLDCTKYGNYPIQINPALDPERGTSSEDCLNLNIWAPADAKPGDDLPVFVWIFGGGWSYGANSQEFYNGTELAKKGMIVVDINYRLGVFGYLSLGILKDIYGTTGNWATLDQILALEWVNKYIGAFGGDSDNITLGGESAGSFSAFNLIMSPKAEGLFQNVILESGTFTNDQPGNSKLDECIEIARGYASLFGATDDMDGLEKLRSIDATELWSKATFSFDLMVPDMYANSAVMDGSVLPLNIHDALKEGKFNKNVNILIGENLCESMNFVNSDTLTQERFDSKIDSCFLGDAQAAKDYYAAQTERSLVEKSKELVGLTQFLIEISYAQKCFADAGVKVYAYNFAYTNTDGGMPAHAEELTYVFGKDYFLNLEKMDKEDLEMRDTVNEYWVNFIKKGDPNGSGLTQWTEFVDGEHLDIMRLDSVSVMENRYNSSLIASLSEYYFE